MAAISSTVGNALGNAFGGIAGGIASGSGIQGANVASPVTGDQALMGYNHVQNGLNNQQAFVSALGDQRSIHNQSSVFDQQQALANQLQGVANGTGPSAAQAQLNQATGANVANQAALMAGQRGASANAGLLARQASNSGANVQQQAAGQAATLRAQEQLGGMTALGQQQASLANTAQQQVTNQGSAIGALTNSSLQNQSNLYNSIAGVNSANVQNQSSINQSRQAITGGLMSGAGAAAGAFAHGGMVGGPKSKAGQHLMAMKAGGKVPGNAAVAGDSSKNDTVSAKLSPGEIVIPRSVLSSPNPAVAAAKFVAEVLAKGTKK